MAAALARAVAEGVWIKRCDLVVNHQYIIGEIGAAKSVLRGQLNRVIAGFIAAVPPSGLAQPA